MDARLDGLLDSSNDADVVIKCHHPGSRTLRAIADGTIRNVFTHRDPRDATASVLRVGGIVDDVDQFVGVLASHLSAHLSYAHGPSLCIPYSEAMDDGTTGVRRIAEFLDCTLDADELEVLCTTLGMEQTRRRAASLTEDDLERDFAHERETLLHINHVTDGRTGTWRNELTPEQARHVEQTLAPFFSTFGYPR